jgi:hypothetical protein
MAATLTWNQVFGGVIFCSLTRKKTNLFFIFFVFYINHVVMTFQERVRAVHILQRFVMVSRALLPRLSELTAKKELNTSEARKLKRITQVYDSFKVNPEYSQFLVDSNIFYLIKQVYETAINKNGQSPVSFYHYDEFIRESDRLIAEWNKQRLN